MVTHAKAKPHDTLLQLVVNVVLPLIILTKFSGKEQLGQVGGLLLALAFPIVWELYRVLKHRKMSLLSVFAIGGIVVTGSISLLGLSEGWLAIRRSVVYMVSALILLCMPRFNKQPVDMLLPNVIDMELVTAAIRKHKTEAIFARKKRISLYAFAGLLLAVGVASYVLTRVVITVPTNTETFNVEYARLRVLSLPFITLPLIIGLTAIVTYLLLGIEKLTGLELDKLLRNK